LLARNSGAMLELVKRGLTSWLDWTRVAVLGLGVAVLSLRGLQHSDWWKDRVYQQLLSGAIEQKTHAAKVLAALGADEQLLRGLKAEDAQIRELAQRGLECVWFNAAGERAYQLLVEAHQVSDAGDWDAARKVLDQLVKKFPYFAEGWSRRAAACWHQDQFDQSRRDCEKALALNPNHYGAWQGLGLCHLQQGDVREACRCLRAALRIVPYDQATLDSLARCERLLEAMSPSSRAPSANWL
jgi:tetratricopeptide (TPR) repeat protein